MHFYILNHFYLRTDCFESSSSGLCLFEVALCVFVVLFLIGEYLFELHFLGEGQGGPSHSGPLFPCRPRTVASHFL